tara:strand:- start:53 stop:271 length:219 start_codon:yes stop_codon:yes gene_type:complete
MTSLRDRILKAKNEKEMNTLVEESEKYIYISKNTKTKIKKAAKERLFDLSGNKSKKSKKKGKKNENAAFGRK